MLREAHRLARVDDLLSLKLIAGETLHGNTHCNSVKPDYSVLVPFLRDDPTPLIQALAKCDGADCVELILYDDGTHNRALSSHIKTALGAFPGAGYLVTSDKNRGRSSGRNRLEALSGSRWLLFLDADMIPDDRAFLARYARLIREQNRPLLAVGGLSVKQVEPTATTDLHWKQCQLSECLPAAKRSTNPGRYVFSSNVLVHKHVMEAVPFDPDFVGWGWEDVDWGIRASRRFPVLHIDNTATHIGLDTTKSLIRKYGASGQNFWLAAERHPDALGQSSLFRFASKLSRLPGTSALKTMSVRIAQLPPWLAPVKVRLMALKTYRASVYAEARRARSKAR